VSQALKSVGAHLDDLAGLMPARAPLRRPALEALGAVLAETVFAPADLPGFASSAMDGYAVRVADVPGELIVAGEAAAGAVTEAVVRPGAAVRVMTGSLLPLGTEAVVPIEDTEASGDRIAVRVSTATGRYVRPAGSDVAAGEPVIPAGTRIGPAQIAALYATGHLQPLVQPTVRVAVIATGDELVPGGTAPGTAQR
jgi:molybdopterin molybdotransferase